MSDPDDNKTIAARLERARARRGMSLCDLSQGGAE